MDFELGADAVDRVRQAADLAEVVGEHVRLRRRGRTYEGLCPFHDEKTPSFSVDPDKGLYYCFGCHRGGDVFRFVMETERLSFPEAVAKLAQRFGVHLEPRSPEAGRRRDEKDRIRALLEEAQRFFRDELASPDGAAARRELERRGFDKGTWEEFGFGWAADEWRRLTDHLARRHPQGSLIAAGLAVQPESGKSPYDRFRKRITFPIQAADGSLVGFGGRILGDGEPKYLNSPESALFHKRSTLFSLHRARPEIRARREVVVVEGYFDCLSLQRAGVRHAVATLGTALTPDHARVLRRELGSAEAGAEPKAILCYDGDAAGRRAAATGIRVLLGAGVAVTIVELPPGQDPDDVVREGGPEAMTSLLERAVGPVEFLLSDLPDRPDAFRLEAIKLAPIVCAASNAAMRQNLVEELARRTYLRPGSIEELGQARAPRQSGGSPTRSSAIVDSSGERNLARIFLQCSQEWRQKILERVEPRLLVDERVRALLEAAVELGADALSSDAVHVLIARCSRDDVTAFVAELCNSEWPPQSEQAIRTTLQTVLRRQGDELARQLAPKITAAEQRGDYDELALLWTEKARLKRKLADL